MELQALSWAFAAALVIYGLIERRRLQRGVPPRVRIADAPRGKYVRVVGRIVDGGSLVAPITGRACVSFDAVVLAPARGAPGGPTVVARGVRGTPFVIDDGSGKILVDPRGAFIRVVYDHSVEAGALERERVADPDFIAGLEGQAGLRYDEGVLTIGETVVVSGLVGEATGGADDPVYRRLAPTTLRLTGAPDRPALVSERPDELDAG